MVTQIASLHANHVTVLTADHLHTNLVTVAYRRSPHETHIATTLRTRLATPLTVRSQSTSVHAFIYFLTIPNSACHMMLRAAPHGSARSARLRARLPTPQRPCSGAEEMSILSGLRA